MYEAFAIIGTVLGLLGVGTGLLALAQAQKGDPKGIRSDFRRLESEWQSQYELLSRLEKRIAKRMDREDKSRAAADGGEPAGANAGFSSDADVMAYARKRGVVP